MALILIADDEDAIREVIVAACGLDGHEVCTAATGEEAVEAYGERTPDLMILDLHMPGGGAVEVLDRLETTHAGKLCPAIAMTGFASEDVHDPRMIELLQKPFGIDALRIAVKAALA